MRVELLVVPDCPNRPVAAARLRQALDAAGLRDTGFDTRTVTSLAEAQRIGFAGSPTILINGRDPFADPERVPGLSCRLYRTASGLTSAPDLDELSAAVARAAQTRGTGERRLADAQREHWQATYLTHPDMYGDRPSDPARHAARLFHDVHAHEVLELGAGHGRDTLYLAREGFTVHTTDLSSAGLEQLNAAAQTQHLTDRVTTLLHDARERVPLPGASMDAVFAHMLLCMALTTDQIHALVGDLKRVLRPGGIFVYTVRHTGDAHYRAGTAHGDDIYEHGGFAVHFFSRQLVDALAEGWQLVDVHPFEEGDLPRRLWRITQTLPV
jgi:SAM-dependent methyltransferase